MRTVCVCVRVRVCVCVSKRFMRTHQTDVQTDNVHRVMFVGVRRLRPPKENDFSMVSAIRDPWDIPKP